jgi:recombination protein RecR
VYEGAVQDLIDELGRLPGVGPKSAQRIAFHLLAAESADVVRLVAALQRVQAEVRFCVTCFNVAEGEQCRICRDPRRTLDVICVVEEPKDVVAIERTREFRGRYHVLGGAISPIDGVGPDDLRVKELMTRLMNGAVTELIIATDPNLEGEATAAYLARLVSPMGLAVSSTPTRSPWAAPSRAVAASTPEDDRGSIAARNERGADRGAKSGHGPRLTSDIWRSGPGTCGSSGHRGCRPDALRLHNGCRPALAPRPACVRH